MEGETTVIKPSKALRAEAKKLAKSKEKPPLWPKVSRVDDIVPSLRKFGDYRKVSEIVNKEVLIYLVDEWRGAGDPTMSTGPSMLVACQLEDGSKCWIIVSHEVLHTKLSRCAEQLPVVAKFYKPKGKRYYDVK